MGLPNGALSRARRVEVYSWQSGEVLFNSLDIDELTTAKRGNLDPVRIVSSMPFARSSKTGTAIRLLRCDRLEYKRVSKLVEKLDEELGRIYRRAIEKGLRLKINGKNVTPNDPMYLMPTSKAVGAQRFGDELVYRLTSEHGDGEIRVKFSELPIEKWHTFSPERKRQLGITNGPSVSILRANREIDRGWFFMGSKRRENYDDWWRCEINFEPQLDELFGITHAKQAIVPTRDVIELLGSDLEQVARALNGRVRQRFERAKATASLGSAERQASRADHSLPPLPRRKETVPEALAEFIRAAETDEYSAGQSYRIIASELPTTAAFEVISSKGRIFLLLNVKHPFYRDLYGPLAMSDSPRDQDVAKQIALLILAAARAEVCAPRVAERSQIRAFRDNWAGVLATFLNA
jgi:hypothetical protein